MKNILKGLELLSSLLLAICAFIFFIKGGLIYGFLYCIIAILFTIHNDLDKYDNTRWSKSDE